MIMLETSFPLRGSKVMDDTVSQLPGTRTIGTSPPWAGKTIVAPDGYSSGDIRWVPFAFIVPYAKSDDNPKKKDIPTYAALLIGQAGKLWDGHHRYYQLTKLGYRGDVPVVFGQDWWFFT